MKKIALTAIGRDQSGIVAATTKVLFESGCNLEDSSMTLLEDHFTMLFVLNAPENQTLGAMESALKTQLSNYDLQLGLYEIETEQETPLSKGSPWMITVSGADHMGIMYYVTQCLAAKAINIHHCSSKRLSRADGNVVFLMAIEAEVPEGVSEKELQQDLKSLAGAENLEIQAEPLEVYTL